MKERSGGKFNLVKKIHIIIIIIIIIIINNNNNNYYYYYYIKVANKFRDNIRLRNKTYIVYSRTIQFDKQ